MKRENITYELRDWYEEIQDISLSGLSFLKSYYKSQIRSMFGNNKSLYNINDMRNESLRKKILREKYNDFLILRTKYKIVSREFTERLMDLKASPSMNEPDILMVSENGEFVDKYEVSYNQNFSRINIDERFE